jgi:hypothetical protein
MTGGARLPLGKRIAFSLLVTVGFLVLAAVAGEIILRVKGEKPWEPVPRVAPVIEPGGSLFAPEAARGYALLPGRFTVKQRLVTWHVTNAAADHRLTRPAGGGAAGADAVWIFGDSYTYGWGVEDDETYAWRLQAARPDLDVLNFGIGGYSTLQSLLELDAALAAGGRPKLVILGYSSFHDGRNAMLRGNRKAWVPWLSRFPRVPVAWLEDGKLRHDLVPVVYHEWPLQRASALVNFLEEKYDKAQVLTSHAQAVSEALIAEMAARCRAAGVDFLLLGVHRSDRTAQVLAWARAQGIRTLDVSVDQTLPEYAVPGDGHPSAKAHAEFAAKIVPELPAKPAQGGGG